MKLVVSSYQSKGNESISLFDIDLLKKEYIKKDSLCLTEPSFVISFKENEVDYVITYSKEPITLMLLKVENDKFELIDSYKLPHPFTTLTHLFYLENIKRLYACSYKDGSYLRIDIKNNKFNSYFGYENFKPSLCHQIFYNCDKEEINIVDIKNDNINVYDQNLKYLKTYKIQNASGPRHGMYLNSKIYLITEYSNEVYVVDVNSGKTIQQISSIDTNCVSYGATIFNIDDKIYASNRGEETIAVFKNIDKLNKVDSISIYGKNSRHMIKSKDEKIIITCNMDTNELVLIDIKTKELIMKIPFNKVACVTEL